MRRRLSDEDLRRIKYQIVTGDLSQHESFEYWLSKWPDLIASLGSSERLTEDDFLRQDRATTLSLDGEIVAIHLLSGYQKTDFAKHPYFKPYGPEFFRNLEARKVRHVQSLQWLMADDKFAGYGMGAVIVCLSLKQQVELGFDASVTIARADNAVTNLAVKAGMEVIATSTLHNVPVSHMACFQPAIYPKREIAELVEHYWNHRSYVLIEQQRQAA